VSHATLKVRKKKFGTEDRSKQGPAHAPVPMSSTAILNVRFALEKLHNSLILKEYGNRVRLVFKNYPLDQSLHPNMKNPGHTHSCAAAKAGHAAYTNSRARRLLRYKRRTFKRQKEL